MIRIRRGREPASLAALRPGELVRVRALNAANPTSEQICSTSSIHACAYSGLSFRSGIEKRIATQSEKLS